MADAISEIGDKKKDKWAQVKEQREKLASQNNSKAGDAGANMAMGGAAAAAQASGGAQAVGQAGDSMKLSPEALAETNETNSGNTAQESRVNLGAWGMEGSEAKAGEAGNDVSKAEGVSSGQTVGKAKDTSTNNNPKRASGEAGASESAAGQAGSMAATGVPSPDAGVSAASGTATASKPQTVPGVQDTKASKKNLPF